MKGIYAWALYNVALFSLIGLAICVTESLWGFLGLVALTSYKSEKGDD